MKTKNILVSLFASLTLVGCLEDFHAKPATYTFFPTNHWRVISVIEGEVVVKTLETNLKKELRVVRAKPLAPLTNGQPVIIELSIVNSFYGPKLISAKAYPTME